MQGSVRLGFTIAALVACAVLGLSLFGDRHEDWLLRAAQDAAVRCAREGACKQIDGRGEMLQSTPRIARGVCTQRSGWHAVMPDKKHAVPFVVTCTDGASYLFHIGKFRDAGEAQVMVCAETMCRREVGMLQRY